jgi:hypothetical protein
MADLDLDGNIDTFRSLIDFGRGPVTIAFESFKKDFGLVSGQGDINDTLNETALVLCHLRALGKLHELEGDVPFEVTKQEDGNWCIFPNAEIQRMEPPEGMPSFIPADEVLPLYPGCRTVHEADMIVVRELQYSTEEVIFRGEQQRYFFKHVNRKPKGHTLKEISALALLSHPHIVPLSALTLDSASAVVGMLFPFANRGSLKESVNALAPNAQKLRWIHDIVVALQYITACGHKYEDIKAANIVVFDDDQARLTDFDGGLTDGHFDLGLDCFGLGVLLEDLNCEGAGLDELIRLAKTTKMTLDNFEGLLGACLKNII